MISLKNGSSAALETWSVACIMVACNNNVRREVLNHSLQEIESISFVRFGRKQLLENTKRVDKLIVLQNMLRAPSNDGR